MEGAVKEVGKNNNVLKNCFYFFSLVILFSSFLPPVPEIEMRIDSLHKKI